jgi:hypothetical protein
MRTDALLDSLRGSHTDLARIVEKVVDARRSVVVVSVGAVSAWNDRAPESWATVREWLDERGISVEVI